MQLFITKHTLIVGVNEDQVKMVSNKFLFSKKIRQKTAAL